ncbi:MAG: anthranilate phosphoribosyltransferase [Candidatus Margulisiibacteriota bacterium]|nr:MAG: anthranilate phosphoribosyltransferase [Candidatus Margulisbacteria bacterium GWE2_39_32]PZM82323.1 MAG: anthranilate phosphoribosyltransferase [Candidatus Margulisiibacteriota bacterium]HCT84672.1 anthranilate phosphoribosyltransferase [Candidatus Margulisiibacteriota bacterium]HCY36473.1 anthranilate phosphoribosyltransferase [Candidatus Margulisiibacteriota bacterium]
MMQTIFNKLLNFENLSFEEACSLMDTIMEGRATPIQVGGLLTALRMKKETIDEISGMAYSMRNHAENITPEGDVVDTCGTGGDLSHSFNISTTAAIVASACGIKIAKHGNRSVSSLCGCADLLEELGVNINLSPLQVEKTINTVGIGFMFAPRFHSAMKYAVMPRKELGIRTIFNILGPLTNPAKAQYQVLGVYNANLTETMASVLKKLGSKRALVVHGYDGLDEISISGPTLITELSLNGKITTYDLDPQKYGLQLAERAAITGGDRKQNAEITRSVLTGENKGPQRDITLLNASAAILAANKAEDFQEAINITQKAITSGNAKDKLFEFINYTQKFN